MCADADNLLPTAAAARLPEQNEAARTIHILRTKACAGTKEDLDKTENEKNMNRIVFSGIEIHDLWADDLNWAQRLDKIKSAITNFIKIIKPDLG